MSKAFVNRMVKELNADKAKSERENERLNEIVRGATAADAAYETDVIKDLGLDNPKILKIIQTLKGDDLLIEATLKWVEDKKAAVASAKARAALIELYGQEWFDNMVAAERKRQEEQSGGKPEIVS